MSSKALESYKIDQIANLKRKDLQSLCKKNGIKANSKNTKLIKDLQNKLRQLQKARKSATNSRSNSIGIDKENKSKASNRMTSITKRKTTKRRRRSLRTPSIEPSEPETTKTKTKKAITKTKTNNTNKNTKSKNKKKKANGKKKKVEKEQEKETVTEQVEVETEKEQEKEIEIEEEKVNENQIEIPEPEINDNNQQIMNQEQIKDEEKGKDEAKQSTENEQEQPQAKEEDIPEPIAMDHDIEPPSNHNQEEQAMEIEIPQDDKNEIEEPKEPMQNQEIDGQQEANQEQEEQQEPIPMNTESSVSQSNDIGSISFPGRPEKQQTEIPPDEQVIPNQDLCAPMTYSNDVEITNANNIETENENKNKNNNDQQREPIDIEQEQKEQKEQQQAEVSQAATDINMESPSISAPGPVAMDVDTSTTNTVPIKDNEMNETKSASAQQTTIKSKRMICDTDDEDDQYMVNGNNGSFVDIDDTPNTTSFQQGPHKNGNGDDNFMDLQKKLQELEQDYVSDTNDMDTTNDHNHNQPRIQKLGVSDIGFQSSNNDETMTNSVSVAYINHAMDISNVNNGSLISDEIPDESSNDIIKNGAMIINNDVDQASPINDEATTVTPEKLNDSSLSLDVTPKLNESTEQFVRASLSVGVDKDPRPHIEHKQNGNENTSGLQLQFNEEEEEEDDDDVDMEVTPDNGVADGQTLQDEIDRVEQSLMKSATRNGNINDDNSMSMNTSMLSVNASRITVDSDDHDRGNDKEEADIDELSQEPITKTPVKAKKEDSDDDASPEWKHTPFKAMEIFNSISRSLSVSKSKSVSNDANKNKMEQDQETEKEETTDSKADEYNDDDEVIKDMNITPTGDDNENAKSVTVENLFYRSPARPKQKPQAMDVITEQQNETNTSYIKPQSSIKKGNKTVELACTFADGQKFEFKSVYSPSKSMSVGIDNKRKSRVSTEINSIKKNKNTGSSPYRSRPRSKSMTPISGECLSEKTAAIRAMMEECEKSYNEGQASPLKSVTSISMIDTSSSRTITNNKRRKSVSTSLSVTKKDKDNKKKRGTVPDWNAIHNKQIFSRQPDLAQEYKERQARTERLFGSNKNSNRNSRIDELARTKMSTPGVRQRSKSMIGGRNTANTHNSEKKPSKKRVTIVPSSNDHKFNQITDSRLNRKIQRQPTPYKKNVCDPETASTMAGISGFKNKKASIKPKFNTSFTENTVAESESIEESQDVVTDNKNVNTNKIPKKKLAFDPDKVRSRLFESTSSSKNKLKTKRTSQTPQITRSNSRNKSLMNRSNKSSAPRNWSAVKSKIDTGRHSVIRADQGNKDKNEIVSTQRVTGIKRKLSWSVSDNNNNKSNGGDNKNETKMKEPAQKKRRMSHSVSSSTSNNGNNIKRWQ